MKKKIYLFYVLGFCILISLMLIHLSDLVLINDIKFYLKKRGFGYYYPDQFGNHIYFLLFYLLLIPIIYLARKDRNKIFFIGLIIISTIFIKGVNNFFLKNSCENLDSDGYTHYALWMNDRIPRLDSNLIMNNKKLLPNLLININNNLLIYNDNNFLILENSQIKTNNIQKKNYDKIYFIKNRFYGSKNNKLFLIDQKFQIKQKIFEADSDITNLKFFNDHLYLSTLKGNIFNLDNQRKVHESTFPIKNFYFINENIYILNYFNEIYTYKNQINLNKIQLTNSLLSYSKNFNFDNFFNKQEISLDTIEKLFLTFSNKNFEIKEILKIEDYFYVFFEDGSVLKNIFLNELINIATNSANHLEIKKKIQLLPIKFQFDKILFFNQNIYSINLFGDLFIYDTQNNIYEVIKNSYSKLELKDSFFGLDYSKSFIRLPGYPMINAMMMKVLNKFNACSIIFLQIITLSLILYLIFFLIYKNKSTVSNGILIFFMLIFMDPNNYLLKLASVDSPHFFEMIFFSIFVYMYFFCKTFYVKRYFSFLLIIIFSFLVSVKILLAIIFLIISDFLYQLFLKKKNNKKKYLQNVFLIVIILFISSVGNKHFSGQSLFNKANIKQKPIGILISENSSLNEVRQVNNFVDKNQLTINKKVIYDNYDIFGIQKIPIFTRYLSGFEDNYTFPLVDLETGFKINIIDKSFLELILLEKKEIFKNWIYTFFKNFDVIFTISDVQKKNILVLIFSFLIFIFGFVKSLIFFKRESAILFLCLIITDLFYSLVAGPQSRFFVIFFPYLIFLYLISLNFLVQLLFKKK